MNNKTVLILDNTIPTYDTSAGYKTTDMYIDMLLDLGFNVKIMPLDFLEDSQYSSYYRNKSVDILTGETFKKNYKTWCKQNLQNIDYVFVNTPRAISYINYLKKYTKAKIIYHGRDIHFIREYERYKLTKSLKVLLYSKICYFVEKYLYKKSDIFATVSLKEVEIINKLFPKLKACYFPVFYYKEFIEPINNFNERKNLLFVGANHLPNIDAIKWFDKQIFPLIKAKLPKIKLIVVGNLPNSLKNEIKNPDIVFKGKVSNEELEQLYNQSKIAIAPLRFGAGVKGKTIEAMYHCLPIVATDFALEGLPSGIQKIIVAKNTAKDFANEIINLYDNNNASIFTKVKELNKYVRENFSYYNALTLIKDIFN